MESESRLFLLVKNSFTARRQIKGAVLLELLEVTLSYRRTFSAYSSQRGLLLGLFRQVHEIETQQFWNTLSHSVPRTRFLVCTKPRRGVEGGRRRRRRRRRTKKKKGLLEKDDDVERYRGHHPLCRRRQWRDGDIIILFGRLDETKTKTKKRDEEEERRQRREEERRRSRF